MLAAPDARAKLFARRSEPSVSVGWTLARRDAKIGMPALFCWPYVRALTRIAREVAQPTKEMGPDLPRAQNLNPAPPGSTRGVGVERALTRELSASIVVFCVRVLDPFQCPARRVAASAAVSSASPSAHLRSPDSAGLLPSLPLRSAPSHARHPSPPHSHNLWLGDPMIYL